MRYGIWLAHAGRSAEALRVFSDALDIDPDHLKANYFMGIALESKGSAYLPEATTYMRRATYAQGYTDEDDLDQANAANELSRITTDAGESAAALKIALRLYQQAITLNPSAVTAIWDRGQLYDRLGETGSADRDLREAAELHSHDATMLQTYSNFLKRHGRAGEAAGYAQAARAASAARIPKDEALEWQPNPVCGYRGFDLKN